MSLALWSRVRRRMAGQGGFTLIELLVASFIFLILGGVLFTAALSSANTVKSSKQYNDLNEEARVMLNRTSRELREAVAIKVVTNPAGSAFNAAANSSITFDVDFNGNGVIEPDAADPEELTYVYDYANSRVLLQAAGQTLPVLASQVSAFKISYTSRLYQYDGKDGTTPDGVVNWWELDADRSAPGAPCNGAVGNCNGVLDQELDSIDSVTIEVTVLKNSKRQDYRTQIDLRNRPA